MNRRVVGIDLGSRRVGVAVSDSDRTVATPYTTLLRTGDAEADRRAVRDLVEEIGASTVVVGEPLSLDGRRGRAAMAAVAEADALAEVLSPVQVELFDERFTTVTAAQGLSPRVARRGARKVVDQGAAAVMLQAWLDARRRT
ncbi:MAG: Holliday junction resolvase RuvX [Acidimicrobiales bacterium]